MPSDTRLSSSPSSITTLLQSCKSLTHLHQLHALLIRTGLVHLLSTSLFNSLLQHSHSQSSSIFSLFIFMKRAHHHAFAPDRSTYPSLAKACALELDLKQGFVVHASALRSGVDADVYVGTSLVDMYGKCGDACSARKVFDEMRERNVVTWTALVVGYVCVGDMNEASKVFDEMPERNVASWNAVVSGFSGAGDMGRARRVFDLMPRKNVVSFTAMVDGYAKFGDMGSARVVFEAAPVKDVVMWSALISGYVQNGLPDEAVEVFVELRRRNVEPDEFVMVSLMSACSQVGCLELAEWVDSYLRNSKIDICKPHVLSALMDMNAKCGNMERAATLFESLANRDLIVYCSMIHGMSVHGRGNQAVALFYKMLSEGFAPDEIAFKVILTACSRSRLVAEGRHFFELMRHKYNIIPSPDHYACMVDLLGRSGYLKEAYELLQSMPVEHNVGAWGALLGACKVHCDVEIGVLVAKRLLVLVPENTGTYVLLSDIYAASDRWLDVSVLRNKMHKRGIKTIPGISSI